MSLLQQIQESVVEEGADLGSILLKLKLLAARLDSDILEEWVKHESAGYPEDVEVPFYRVTNVIYNGTFSGSYGKILKNASIPPYFIEKHAGEKWIKHKVREGIAVINKIAEQSDSGSEFGLNASNLTILLNDNVFSGYSCIGISATIPKTEFYEIIQAVRNRILEFTIELERSVPEAMQVSHSQLGFNKANKEQVQQISQQIFYGSVNTAVAGGANAQIQVTINQKDNESLIRYLVEKGIPESDATELAEIMEKEEPTSSDEPFGKKAQKWITDNLPKASKGAWNITVSVATAMLTKAALLYYGLK